MHFRPIVAALSITACIFAQPQKKTEEQKQTVVVTGTYEPMALEEADRSIRVVPARDLGPTTGTISDLLNLDPSVDLRERAPGAVNSGLSIRGGSFGQTLVLWNGMRLNNVQTSNLSMDVPMAIDSLAQVEILKGSGSTLYGSDATAGVVNFISRPPENSEIRLKTGFGNWGTQQQRASLAYSGHGVSQHFTVSRDFSTGFRDNRDYRNASVSSVTHWRGTELDLAMNDRPYGADQFYGNYNSWERTKGWFAGIRQKLGKNMEAAYAFRRSSDLFVLYRDQPERSTNRHIVESQQFNLRRTDDLSGNARLHLGAEGLYDSITSNNLGRHSRMRSAVFGAYDIRALQRFSLTLGAREEIYRNLQQQFNPSIGTGFWVNQRLKLRASASRAFRLPTYTDLYYKDPANIGNPLLRPESAWSYEGGVDINSGGAWKGSLTVFQRREKDGIDYVRANTTDVWRATNFQSLHFTGVEASVTTVVRRIHRLEFAYTGLDGAQEVLSGMLSKYVFNYPRHAGLATWQASFKEGWMARTRLGALERLGRNPYAVLDFFASWQRGPVRPYVQLTNIANTSYQEQAGIPMPGRAVLGGVELVWTKQR